MFEFFPKLAKLANITEEELTQIKAYQGNAEENPLSDELKGKLSAVNDTLATKEYLRNLPEFVQTIKNDRLAKTMRGIEEVNMKDWLSVAGDFLHSETVESTYKNPDLEKATDKEKAVRRQLVAEFNKRLAEANSKVETMAKKGDEERNKTILSQSDRIKELEAEKSAFPQLLEAEVEKVRREFKLKEASSEVFSRLDRFSDNGKKFVSDTDRYNSTLKKNFFAWLSETYHVEVDASKKILLINPETNTRAIDEEAGTVITFDSIMQDYLIDYGAITMNKGKEAKDIDVTKQVQGGSLYTHKQKASIEVEGVATGSQAESYLQLHQNQA